MIPPVTSRLICGDVGEGAIESTEKIVKLFQTLEFYIMLYQKDQLKVTYYKPKCFKHTLHSHFHESIRASGRLSVSRLFVSL